MRSYHQQPVNLAHVARLGIRPSDDYIHLIASDTLPLGLLQLVWLQVALRMLLRVALELELKALTLHGIQKMHQVILLVLRSSLLKNFAQL